MEIKQGPIAPETKEMIEKLSPEFGQNIAGFFRLMNLYKAAIREIGTKLEILDEEFAVRFKRNPIHHMESRLKRPVSIMEKLVRKGFEANVESVYRNLTDVAGVRVVCYYLDDVYRVAELLLQQDDIRLRRRSDYIKQPKETGYRSLHLVVEVPVFLSGGKEIVPVEVQIRTVGMDYWASLEHQLRYKAPEKIPQSVKDDLKKCAGVLAVMDEEMLKIFKKVREIDDRLS